MKDLGTVSFVLGIQIHRDRSRGILGLSQTAYIDKVLSRFGMKDCAPGDTPIAKGDKFSLLQCPRNKVEKQEMDKIPYASAIGSLMYAQVCTRPDIAYIVGMLGRYLSNLGIDHWKAVKRVMMYLKRTKDFMLTYQRSDHLEIVGYSDSDFAGCLDSRRSTSGYIFMLAGGAVSWKSVKQTLIASSTMEADPHFSSPIHCFFSGIDLPSEMLLLYQTCASLFPARPNSRQRVLSAGGNRCHHMIFSLGTRRRFLTVVAKAAPAGDIDTFTKYSGYLFENGVLSEAEFLTEYDLRSIAAIYRRKPFLVLRRFVQIGTKFGRWFAVRYIDRLLERSDEMFKIRASELRMILLELGPAFVKIAQAVSSRPDVIPPAYLNELSLLQDQIAPFSTELAFNIMEKELGLPIDGLFSEISPEPVAAASLGQVYQARLCTSGKIIAIKVQRPGVQAAISLDIYILRYLAGLIKKAAKLNTDLQVQLECNLLLAIKFF
ncbi:hypothetical protein KFK09_020090 [Dendrobium nobile]|uniref:ABC1 atypical kinase-like domain-containing protein n=1 Tax=Dendrobium nobile TaxID=94219 RepID=A0A8T3ASX2_DENNO|nr:hypothetical protein KFK09_020090 [Dendrobium nobile]